jgi:hypothetical protein
MIVAETGEPEEEEGVAEEAFTGTGGINEEKLQTAMELLYEAAGLSMGGIADTLYAMPGVKAAISKEEFTERVNENMKTQLRNTLTDFRKEYAKTVQANLKTSVDEAMKTYKGQND